jgi:hypothetical protein
MTLSTLLLGLGFALASPSGDAAQVEAQLTGDLSLAVHTGQTHFTARSLSTIPLLLVFSDEYGDGGPEVAFWLPPGASYVESFARGALEGLQLEVVHGGNGQWTSTGTLSLSEPAPAGDTNIWVLGCGHALTGTGGGAALTVQAPNGSSLPAQLSNCGASIGATANNNHSAAFHVPVPAPSVKPKENKPPKLGKKPLPPV